jgi:hypothetical protein
MPGNGYILEESYCYLSLHVTNGIDAGGLRLALHALMETLLFVR